MEVHGVRYLGDLFDPFPQRSDGPQTRERGHPFGQVWSPIAGHEVAGGAHREAQVVQLLGFRCLQDLFHDRGHVVGAMLVEAEIRTFFFS